MEARYNCGCYHDKFNINQWCLQTKDSKLYRIRRQKWAGTASYGKALGLQMHRQEAGVHRDTHEGSREEWAARVPTAITDTVVRRAEPGMGLPSLFCNMLRALSSIDPSPTLCGEDVFGSDFGLNSSKIPVNIPQIGQD